MICARQLVSGACPLYRRERTANDQLGERVCDLAVALQIGLNVLLHGERHVTRSPNVWGHPSALSGQDGAQGLHT